MARPKAHRSTACAERTASAARAGDVFDFELFVLFAEDALRLGVLFPTRVVDARAADCRERWAGDDREA